VSESVETGPPNAAFTYEHPWRLARRRVEGRIAFLQGVEIVRDRPSPSLAWRPERDRIG
jgi:hypothetical protein